MAKGYTYNENGELEEELELSVDGGEGLWCERCQRITYHSLAAISSVRGEVYVCARCGSEVSGEINQEKGGKQKMIATEEIAQKVRIHTVYKLACGDRVPSVTTVIGILNKPALLQWAWEMGTQELDYKAVRDRAGDIGTLAHYFILCDLKGERPDSSEYSQQDIEKAKICLIHYWDWVREHRVEPIMLETPLISEQYRFGGTIDFLGKVDGQLTLVDFKTGKGIYDEFLIQLSAYEQLLAEAKQFPEVTRLLRIGRNKDDHFEERITGKLDKQWQIFLHCLGIYNLQKEVRNG